MPALISLLELEDHTEAFGWDNILSLLTRSWFTRAWIVQEFACAPHA